MRDIMGMMGKVKEMQAKMEKMQAEIAELTAEGKSGGGLVTVRPHGKGECRA
jgi:DNA-binding protein YbaB